MSVFSNDIDLNILLHGIERYAADLSQESAEQIRQAIIACQNQQPNSETQLIHLIIHNPDLDRLYGKALADRRAGYITQERAKSLELSIGRPLTAEINHTIAQLATTIEQLLTHRQQLSRTTAIEQILKTLEKSHLTPADLTHLLTQPPQQTETILHHLWQQGYIDRLTAPFPYILFPSLRNPQYRATLPSDDAFLTLTTKGYFYLYPLIKRADRLASA